MNATWNYRLSLRMRLAVLFAAVAILPFSLSMVRADEETEAQQDSAADAAADDAVVADAPDDAISDDAPEGAATTPAADADLFGPADGDPFGHATDDLFGDPGTAQAADEAATPKYAARTQREAELERGLKLLVRLDFVDTPLEEVISFLTDSAGVDIYLDPRGLSEEGVSSDTPVSISLNHEVSLGSALNLILEPLHLSYVIEDEVLTVTSETRGAKEVTPRNTPNEDMRIAAGDIVRISVAGTWADAPIDDNFRVEPSGSVGLGPHYGRVKIAGQTPEGAEEAITAHLKQFLKEPQVQVTLGGWERDRNRYADRRYTDAPHSPFSVDPVAGDLRSYVARLHQPIGAAELEILRDHVQFLQDQFNAVDARFKAGTSGGTAEVREVAASRLAEARAELKLAEGKRDEALAQLKVARTHAEEALKAVKAAHEVGQVSHDRVLQAAQEVANVKRKLLHVERATAQSSTNAVLTLPVTARRNDDFSDIAEKMSQASVLAGENVSVSFLKEIVEAKRREKERIHKLYEAGKASLRAARNAGAEHQISEERLRQAMREAERRKLLVDLAEVELQQAIEAKRKSPGAISELEIKKMMLKLELAKAQFRALAE